MIKRFEGFPFSSMEMFGFAVYIAFTSAIIIGVTTVVYMTLKFLNHFLPIT